MNRVKAALVVLVGLVLAAGMSLAGVWQLEVYQQQGAEAAAARAAEPAIPLLSVARAGTPVGDGYGRTVVARGTYEAAHQLTVPVAERPDLVRVVSLFRLDDGQAVAVVRGVVPPAAPVPPVPDGAQDQAGVLLPSEEAAPPAAGAALGSVRIAQLAQQWPGPLVDGYLVLGPADAQAQGLTPAEAALPEARGRLRNAAYALQWWVFAAFSVVMAIRIARDVGRPALAGAALDPSPSPRPPAQDG